MIFTDNQVLDSLRFNALVQDQATRYQESLPLTFLDRLGQPVPADDDEIIGSYTGKIFAAPIIADDQAAPVYEAGQLELVTNTIPNLKMGQRFSQRMLNRLTLLKRAAGLANTNFIKDEFNIFRGWETNTVANLIRGIREQQNVLSCAMYLDSFNYNSLGVQITGSWGTPSGLKATPGTAWTSTSATPITDILTMATYAANTYGEVFNRVTLSTTDFMNAVKTTEFKNLIQGLVNAPLAVTAFNVYDMRQKDFFRRLLGDIELVIDDKTVTTKNADGSVTTGRVLPLGKVILDDARDDRNRSAADMANAIVTESMVAELTGEPEGLGGAQYGPVGYYTAPADMNPPNATAWGVARCFPRKHRKTMNAVLTVQ